MLRAGKLTHGILTGINSKNMESTFFLLKINQERGRLELCQVDKILGSIEWKEERKTSQEILEGVQILLQKSGLQAADVPDLRLELDLSPHATARRIAETIQNTYNTFVTK